jgi:hypothetical protein
MNPSFFYYFGRINIKDSIHLNLLTHRLITLSGNPDTSHSICSAKNLDFEMFTLIPVVESLGRTISNLFRWSLKLTFVSCNKSSRQNYCLNIFHILDKRRDIILENIRNQDILISMGKRLYLYFPTRHGNTIVHSF